MDPLQWMGAVRMRVQTADKNITIIQVIHMKWKTVFVTKFSSESSIHNIAFSSEQSGENYAQSSTVYKWKQFLTNMSVDLYVRG